MWDMNKVDYRTATNTSEVEISDDEGNTTTTSVTKTVLTIELAHKTAEAMRTEYTLTVRIAEGHSATRTELHCFRNCAIRQKVIS